MGFDFSALLGVTRFRGRIGEFWMEDYFDRYIRDKDHFTNAVKYYRKQPDEGRFV